MFVFGHDAGGQHLTFGQSIFSYVLAWHWSGLERSVDLCVLARVRERSDIASDNTPFVGC